MKKFDEKNVAENPLYHDTWKLLKKYRDVVWSLELSVQHVRTKFEIEYGTSIEDFLDSVYLAGADLAGSDNIVLSPRSSGTLLCLAEAGAFIVCCYSEQRSRHLIA